MREEINILWIDDTKSWVDITKKTVNRHLREQEIAAQWDIETECDSIYNKILNQTSGFNAYDIFLIDYNLSIKNSDGDDVSGNDLIRLLRKIDIQVDILFYSSNHEKDIREMISNDFGNYEGVYISDRTSFENKVMKLIKKTARKSYSLSNIRGYLTNETSENDFIANSIIYTCFDKLNVEQQEETLKDFKKSLNENLCHINSQKEKLLDMLSKFDSKFDNIKSNSSVLNENKNINIKRMFNNHSLIITQKIKYEVFKKMISFLAADIAKDFDYHNYMEKVIKMRNTLAHKKLDLCKEQKYINFADDILQYQSRACPKNCSNHTDDFKVSVEEWEKIKKLTFDTSKKFDKIFEYLLSENIVVHDELMKKIF